MTVQQAYFGSIYSYKYISMAVSRALTFNIVLNRRGGVGDGDYWI